MILKKHLYILLCWLMLQPAFAQNWANAGSVFSVSQVRTLTTDTINHKLYAGGDFYDAGHYIAYMTYNGLNWVANDTVNNLIDKILYFNGDLYIGGWFTIINSLPIKGFAKWNGVNWIDMGVNFGSVYNLRVIGNELYACGTFTSIGGINANGIAKWNGISWISFGFPSPSLVGDVSYITDCAIYKGDLYVGGNFQVGTAGINDIAVLKGGVWQRVGDATDSLRGGFTNLARLEVYKNELYIGGLIKKADGNTGNGVQRWNGFNWRPLGLGIQSFLNDETSNCHVSDMMQYKGKLFIGGAFLFASNLPAPSLASWDGEVWCAIDTLIDKSILSFSFFQDSLYVGTLPVLEGINVNCLAKYTKNNCSHTDTCSIKFDTNVIEKESDFHFNIYPNPTSFNITIESEINIKKIEILDALGQILITHYPNKLNPTINITSLASGIYYLTVQDNSSKKTVKIIKQ